MRIPQAQIRGVVLAILSLAAPRLGAQSRPAAASMTVQVKVPSSTPAGDTIWFWGGLLLAPTPVPMSRVPSTTDTWQTTISAPAGTILRYVFERNEDPSKAEIYVPTGSSSQIYRELFIKNGATISETVAKWGDIPLSNISTGALTGAVSDQAGNPLMGIWVSAGPHQTFTDANGNFIIYGVPAGACTVTVRSENGEFQTVNVPTTLSPNVTTVQNIALAAATMFPVTFNVTIPPGTPVNAVPRLFGDTYRLGMVQIPGGPEPDSTRVIDMTPAGGSQWSYTVQLGSGTCVKYFYTLGSQRLNVERDNQGNSVTRALCVTGPTTVSDTVTSWKTPLQVPASLTATSPTGAEDTLYVATDDYLGNAPVKMWPTGPGKAAFTIYANPSTALKYHYIRNADPGVGVEIVGTDTNPPAYRSLAVGPGGANSSDTIVAWRNQMHETALTTVTSGMAGPVVPHSSGEPFQTGVMVIDYWRSSWMPLVAPTMARIKSMNAQWVQIRAVWSFLTPTSTPNEAISVQTTDPPKGELFLNDFPPQDLLATIRAAKAAGLHVALTSDPYPPNFPGVHSNAWYDEFFQQIQSFSVYYATIAQQEGVEMLILSNVNFDADTNSDAATRTYINAKWKSVIAAIRASGYTGKLTSASLTFAHYPEYDWFGDLDYLGDDFWRPVATSDNDTVQTMYDQVIKSLITVDLPIVNRFHKPLIFTSVNFYSARSSALQTYGVFDPKISDFSPADPSVPSDYDEQARAYQAVLLAFAATPWVQGCYSFGYQYFTFDSKGYSIRGKTAEQILSQIYQQINTNPPSNLPVITSVDTLGGYPLIAQNSWIEIKGANLAPPGVGPSGITWDNATEFATGTMPTQLGTVSATVNGKPAFVYYVSATQVNVLTPLDDTTGPAQVVVTRSGAASVPFYVNMAASAPTSLLVGATNYVLATHADYSLIGPASLSVPGYPFSPARPGERITLWATGFALPKDGVVNGSSSQSGTLPVTPGVRIGGINATMDFAAGVTFAGLVGPGLYQVNIIVPSNVPDGDNKVRWFYQQGEAPTYPPGALIAVQR